jgi:hypothetical protein
MTMLGKSEGDDSSTGASYLEIAEFLMRNGAAPDEDLAQLWKRIVFSIAISTTEQERTPGAFARRRFRLSCDYFISIVFNHNLNYI